MRPRPPGRRSRRRRSRGSAPRPRRPAARPRGSPLGGEVLEDLAGEHPSPAAARLGNQEQKGLRVALQLERAAPGDVRGQLQPVAEVERLRPLGVGRAEVADEADDGVVEAGLRERGQERPRVALAKKLPVWVIRSRLDAGTRCRRSRRSPNRSRSSPPGRSARARAPRPRSRRQRPRSRPHSAQQVGDPVLALLLEPREPTLGAAVRVGDERVAQIGDPARAGCALDRRADEVDGAGREVVSTTSIPSRRAMRIAAGIAVRFQGTFSSGDEQPAAEEPRLVVVRARPVFPCSSCAGRRPRGPR